MEKSSNEYARGLYHEELKKARRELGKCVKHLQVALALQSRFDFEVPAWAECLLEGEGLNRHVAEALDVDSESDEGEPATPRPVLESITEAVLEYFQRHLAAAEPSDVDEWVREAYAYGDLRDPAVAEAMSRLTRQGRLYSHKYPGERASLYGLPSWQRGGLEDGFLTEYLPPHLRRREQGRGPRGVVRHIRSAETGTGGDGYSFRPDPDLPF